MVAGILETHPEIINMKSPEALIEIKKLFHFQIAVNQSVSKPVLELKPILSSESLAQLPKPRELFLSTNNPEPSTNARSTTLTDRQQTIINLFKDGMSILEISHQLKITPSAVYQNITTLRGKGFLPPKQLKSHSEPELIYRSTKTQQKILTIYQTYKDITGNFPTIEYLIQETGLSKSYIYSCISNIRNKIPGLKLEKKPNCQVKKSENQNLGLTPKQQKILTLYQELTQQNHGFPPSIEKLEEKTGYKKSTIYRYLHIFETKKLIIRETKISPKTELTFKQQNFLTIYQKKIMEFLRQQNKWLKY